MGRLRRFGQSFGIWTQRFAGHKIVSPGTLIHTPKHKEYCTCQVTGEFLAQIIEEIIKKIEQSKFSAIVSDSEANIRNARQIITGKYKNINVFLSLI